MKPVFKWVMVIAAWLCVLLVASSLYFGDERANARRRCHKILSQQLGSDHDAFLELGRVGNVESIPYLIEALKRQEPPKKDGSMICVTAHCLDALYRITGYYAGNSYPEWKRWWDETGSKLRPDQFPLKTAKQSSDGRVESSK